MGPKRRLRDRIGQPATIIGPEARIEGDLAGKGHFLVAGEIRGDADVEGAVTVADGARWQGNIRADDVIVAGTVSGQITARGSLEITASARIDGRISAARVAMAQGSVVEGEVHVAGDGEVRQFEDRRGGAA